MNLRDFFLQLGSGFLYAGSEYKLDYYGKYFYVDILLFNINLNCYIPVELKLNSTNYKDVSQVQLYRKIIDNTIKKKNHNKSIGLIISKKNDNGNKCAGVNKEYLPPILLGIINDL